MVFEEKRPANKIRDFAFALDLKFPSGPGGLRRSHSWRSMNSDCGESETAHAHYFVKDDETPAFKILLDVQFFNYEKSRLP